LRYDSFNSFSSSFHWNELFSWLLYLRYVFEYIEIHWFINYNCHSSSFLYDWLNSNIQFNNKNFLRKLNQTLYMLKYKDDYRIFCVYHTYFIFFRLVFISEINSKRKYKLKPNRKFKWIRLKSNICIKSTGLRSWVNRLFINM
jgi:hypothetical protein